MKAYVIQVAHPPATPDATSLDTGTLADVQAAVTILQSAMVFCRIVEVDEPEPADNVNPYCHAKVCIP